MKRLTLLFLSVMAFGCASSPSGDEVQLIDGFNPPPAPEGYKRYVAPAIHRLLPGQDLMFCQWIDVAPDEDVDIVDLQGYQTLTGHHVVLYSSSLKEPVGTSRECTTDDMVSVEFLGGVGGEGGGNASKLPDGLVFRQGKGRTLLANTHYLNATDQVMDVQSVLDVKTAAPSAAYTAAGMAVINYLDFQIPPNSASYSVDAYCTWPRDTSLVMWSNHMHENGLTVVSDVKHADGTVESLATDPSWRPEAAFNPTWTQWPLGSQRLIKAGDQTHIKCTWKNTGATMKRFPDEMCDGVGFYTESPEMSVCDATAN
jgi:hypothetical protein